ncbi:hypothetical protein [uncultured Croceicoccus sp.]|uniref:hypothetical protein n=1 Tax=uncultured Croceicoccus sp. TaxID=1295329 RepID=UPI00261931FF|nr:hypothetical protein [uncultured Croceicoccus sp.]
MAQLAELVDAAGKVTVYPGIGARDARDEIVAFCEKVKAPMVHTTQAKEFLEPDNPYNVGVNGILGNCAGVEALETADLVISPGCNFAYMQSASVREKCESSVFGLRVRYPPHRMALRQIAKSGTVYDPIPSAGQSNQ